MGLKQIFSVLFLFTSLNVFGQHSRIGYISDLIFFVESNTILNEEVAFNIDGIVEVHIPIVSQKIKVGIPLKDILYSTIHKIDYNTKRKKPLLSQIEYKIERGANDQNIWSGMSVYPQSANDSVFILIDTLLQIDSYFKILFRYKSDRKVFETITIDRKNIVPIIRLYRETSIKDTTASIFQKIIVNKNNVHEKFLTLNDNRIQIAHGNVIELIFDNRLISSDSNILYRIYPSINQDTVNWTPTGLFCSIKGLESNKTYILDVKYDGSDLFKTYELSISPKWFQHTSTILIVVSIILGLAALFLFILFHWKLRKEKKKRDRIIHSLKAIQSQLNPHFIFNALTSIQSLINKDKKEQANQYLNSFSKVLRYALENGGSLFVPMILELELVKNYLDLEKLRFNFSYEIKINETININEIEIPPMLFQPTLENAIKHGIANLNGSGVINILIDKKDNGFEVSISDNGKWQNKMEVDKGYGIKLTEMRILATNQLMNGKLIKHFITAAPTGTYVNFVYENWFL